MARMLLLPWLLLALQPVVPGSLGTWQRQGEVEIFSGRDLFKAIDGGAEIYFSYGFERLELASFTAGTDRIEGYFYRMSTPLAAWGIFSRERPEQALDIAGATSAALRAPHLCTVLKGAVYVKLTAVKGQLDAKKCTSLLQAAAAALPGASEAPAELKLLPVKNRLPGTVGLEPGGYQGLSELAYSLYAGYRLEGHEYEVFLLLAHGGKSARERFEKLAAPWQPVAKAPWPAKTREIPYAGPVLLARDGEKVIGITGMDDTAAGLKALATLLETNKP